MAVSMTDEGIIYPASVNVSSNANTLDDYEEGSYSISFNSYTGFDGSSSSSVLPRYTRIADLVHLNCSFYLSGTDSSLTVADRVTVAGVPFAISSNSTASAHFSAGFNYNDGSGCLFRALPTGTTSIRLVATALWGSPTRAGGRFQIMGGYYLTH